jgi:alpha-galactosidase
MKNRNVLFSITFSLCCLMPLQAQKFDGLANTPPMGWNSWNKFACDVNETKIREVADAMAASGMKDAGYEYIVIDDCWHGERDANGFITANAQRFPSGMPALSAYIHSKGLKFGIYSCVGDLTCGGRPGSRGHEYQDALTYASWGVDYLKYDWCYHDGISAVGAYTTMRDALHAAGRPVVFSLCEWGENKPWMWAKNVGHLWRTTGDIYNCFDCVKNNGTWNAWGTMQILDMQDTLRSYAGPDHWNDPDMLEVGNGMSVNEDRAHFTMWCFLAAPLMAGNDLRSMTTETYSILSNKDVIAIDQDSLGIQGFRHAVKDSVETWLKPLANGAWAVCFLNRATSPRTLHVDWNTFSVTDPVSGLALDAVQKPYLLRDLWLKKNLGDTRKMLKTTLPAHDVLCLKLVH